MANITVTGYNSGVAEASANILNKVVRIMNAKIKLFFKSSGYLEK